MKERFSYAKASPAAYRAMLAINAAATDCGLEASLIHLVKMRASQINGCAFCIDMHAHEALAGGERPERLYLLSAWREAGVFNAREQAALTWTESLTNIAQTGVPDTDWEPVRAAFSEKEIADLTLVICVINSWNRFAVSARSVPASAMETK